METRPFQAGFDGRGDFITPAQPRTERAIQSGQAAMDGSVILAELGRERHKIRSRPT